MERVAVTYGGLGDERWEGLNPPYATIVADPPWDYPTAGTGTSRRGVNPPNGNPGHVGKALPYSALSLDEIKALQLGQIADGDSRIFLWTTNRYLRHAWDVMEAWGFHPQDRVLVWCKPPRATTPVTTEFVLIGKHGSPPQNAVAQHNMVPVAALCSLS